MRPPSAPGSAFGSRITFRRPDLAIVATATSALTKPNSFCRTAWDRNWAVNPPRMLPAAVATSRSMPNLKFIKCCPALPAVTVLDVAITVARLMPAATPIGSPSPRLRSGTRKMPPPRPSRAPRLPAAAPATKMISETKGVTCGTSHFEPARLREVAGGLFERALLGFRFRRPLGAREARAGIDIRDRAVIDLAELVGLDRDRPAGKLLLTA